MNKKELLKVRLHEIIFEADTKEGKWFDLILIVSILFSVVIVMLDSVSILNIKYGFIFSFLEWLFTILFTVEYILRIYVVKKPFKYIFSFYGIIDFLSIIPTFLSILTIQTKFLVIIRTIRLLRIFRVLKLVRYLRASEVLYSSLKNSRHKIFVFLIAVLTLVIIIGSLMYLIEGPERGFTSIPTSVYWAIVTLTTVGYGDIAPQTPLGQAFASMVMILGYGIIAVPTGLITLEMSKHEKLNTNTQVCSNCNCNTHQDDAKYCKVCGEKL